jgi:hypothetical protein
MLPLVDHFLSLPKSTAYICDFCVIVTRMPHALLYMVTPFDTAPSGSSFLLQVHGGAGANANRPPNELIMIT